MTNSVYAPMGSVRDPIWMGVLVKSAMALPPGAQTFPKGTCRAQRLLQVDGNVLILHHQLFFLVKIAGCRCARGIILCPGDHASQR